MVCPHQRLKTTILMLLTYYGEKETDTQYFWQLPFYIFSLFIILIISL